MLKHRYILLVSGGYMKPSEICKEYGFASMKEVAGLVGVSTMTLQRKNEESLKKILESAMKIKIELAVRGV